MKRHSDSPHTRAMTKALTGAFLIAISGVSLGCASLEAESPTYQETEPAEAPHLELSPDPQLSDEARDGTIQTRGSSSTRAVHLKSYNGQYVVAEGAGGGAVNANRPKALGWETFDLIDHNGGTLNNGDSVSLRTNDGRHFVAAENRGGGAVNAHGTEAKAWEVFRIRKLSRSLAEALRPEIKAGAKVAFQTDDRSHYLGAEGGGGGVVNAHGTKPLEWETFTLEFVTPSPQITTAAPKLPTIAVPKPRPPPTTQPKPPPPPVVTPLPKPTTSKPSPPATASEVPSSTIAVHLRSFNGQYVVAEQAGGNAVNANREEAQGWETFDLIDHNGAPLRNGESVSLRTNDGRHYVAAEHDGGAAVNAHGTQAGPWETFSIYKAPGKRGRRFGLRARLSVIRSGDAVVFRTNNKRHFLGAENGGGGVVNAHGDKPLEWETFTLQFAASSVAQPTTQPAPTPSPAPPTPTPMADLSIQGFDCSDSLLDQPGQSLSVAIKNVGDAPIPSGEQLRIMVESQPKGSTEWNFFNLLSALTIPAPGEVQEYTIDYAVGRPLAAGEYSFRAEIDQFRRLTDADRDNNQRALDCTVSPSPFTIVDVSRTYGREGSWVWATASSKADLRQEPRIEMYFSGGGWVPALRVSTEARTYEVLFVIPSGAVSGPVKFRRGSVQVEHPGSLRIYGAPEIKSMPREASAGDTITVQGRNFIPDSLRRDGEGLSLNVGCGYPAVADETEDRRCSVRPTSIEETSLTFVVPMDMRTGPVKISTNISGVRQEGESPESLTVLPRIRSLIPRNQWRGRTVAIYGNRLYRGIVTSVAFNGVEAEILGPTQYSAKTPGTQIEVVVPDSATTGKLSVTDPAGTITTEVDYRIILPTIDSISPTVAKPGSVVTIVGRDLDVLHWVYIETTDADPRVSHQGMWEGEATEGELQIRIPDNFPEGSAKIYAYKSQPSNSVAIEIRR